MYSIQSEHTIGRSMPMERKITVTPAAQPLSKRTKTAAYARVSLSTEHMLHSLAAQVSHYSKYIQSRSDWEYAGVYAEANFFLRTTFAPAA
jgi:predicted site-specific integrase-resolvase